MAAILGLALLHLVDAAAIQTTVFTVTSTIPPDYFQTDIELLPLATATGPQPFLAQTNPAPFASVSYIPPHPLETQEPIVDGEKGNIFEHMGILSPYFSGPGFGVDEHALPEGSEIVWANMLSRHGSRYPTNDIILGGALGKVAGTARFTDKLEFLTSWTYKQGVNILSPSGRQELYDSGVLHNYLYGHLYDKNNGSKLLVRTTTQDRMLKSAENFLAGFFGLEWTNNATLEVILDAAPYNNSLAGYNACPNNRNYRSSGGVNASAEWITIYTADAVERLNQMSTGFTWTPAYVHDAQQLCSYETVTLGYSRFCDLFTYQEWLGFEQSLDLLFAGLFGFQSPTGRAVGVAYVEEVLARLNHRLITEPTAAVNGEARTRPIEVNHTDKMPVTLDNNDETFPLNQALNLDFTHDVVIMSVLVAFGLEQFGTYFDYKTPDTDRSFVVSHLTPFGARLDIELIESPHPVRGDRASIGSPYEAGDKTTYIHFILNQRTIPLGKSLSECGDRADGWCELGTFLALQESALARSAFEYSCYGDYDPPAWGAVSDGVLPSPPGEATAGKPLRSVSGGGQEVLSEAVSR